MQEPKWQEHARAQAARFNQTNEYVGARVETPMPENEIAIELKELEQGLSMLRQKISSLETRIDSLLMADVGNLKTNDVVGTPRKSALGAQLADSNNKVKMLFSQLDSLLGRLVI